MKAVLLCLIVSALLAGLGSAAEPGNDPSYALLSRAFEAQRIGDYDAAIPLFREASHLAPSRTDILKNLAYTLLKTGDSEAAREAFGEAVRIDPADLHVALEYAFLCFEARENAPARKAEARRIFARVKETGEGEVRATAAAAFANVDAPLASGIARWRQVLASSPPTFSAHYELAELAEARDEVDLASAEYVAAFRLLPERKSVLLELARVEKTRNNPEGMMAALLAASRGGEPRAAELAREQLPTRYPYVYEFRKALELDPRNGVLHRELAYLLLQMSQAGQAKKEEAEQEFRSIVAAAPDDYLAQAQLGLIYLADNRTASALPILQNVLARGNAVTANRVRMALKMPLVLEEKGRVETPLDPRILGERSYAAGFLKDAKKYFLAAHEENPIDASLLLKLGWTENLLHDDKSALAWFGLAKKSADPAVSTEARRAWSNLKPDLETFRTTLWMYPLFSSRWKDAFGYGQIKTEVRVMHLPFRAYASVRFLGDAQAAGASPQKLSESALIPGVGIATSSWRGATGWFEVGTMIGFLNGRHSADFRGGVTFSRAIGASIAAEQDGWFFKSTADSLFVGEFQNDLINYSQNEAGFTHVLAGAKVQAFWNNNLTFDVKRLYWANFAETGPGFRFHLVMMPPAMTVTVSAIRGAYLRNAGNPRRPNFNDLRIGLWYAFTK